VDAEVNEDGVRLGSVSKCNRVMGMYLVGLEEGTTSKTLLKKVACWLYKCIAISIIYGRLPRNMEPELLDRYLPELVQQTIHAIPCLMIITFDKLRQTNVAGEKRETIHYTRGSRSVDSFSEKDIDLSARMLSSSPRFHTTTCTAEDLLRLMQGAYDYRKNHPDSMHDIDSINSITFANEPRLHMVPLEKHQFQILTGSGSQFLIERFTSTG
jgi:hypothetical protein